MNESQKKREMYIMSFEMTTNKLSSCALALRAKGEQSIETEISLPDYCSEIKRILKCTVTPGVHSVSRTGERVGAMGTVMIRIIYQSENDKTDCYEKSIEMNVSCQMKEITDSMILNGRASTDYVNCRAVGKRKVAIGGSVSVEFAAYELKSRELPCNVEAECIRTRKEKITAEDVVCIGEKIFDMSETAILTKDRPAVERLLRHSSYVTLESKKAVSDKILLKGEFVTSLFYCSGESSKVNVFTHSMPVSQIVEVTGIDDDMECQVLLEPSLVAVNVKQDSDGEMKMVEIAARISAFIKGCREKEAELISDCYSTEGEIEAEYQTTQLLVPVGGFDKTEIFRQGIDLGLSAREICDVSVGDISACVRQAEGKTEAVCKAAACILYTDENGAPSYTERALEFACPVPVSQECEELTAEITVNEVRTEFSSCREGKAEIKTELQLHCRVYKLISCRYLSKLDCCETADTQRPALTLYFCSKDEALWDIAKKYKTTQQAIMQENGLKEKTATESRMLLIPCG